MPIRTVKSWTLASSSSDHSKRHSKVVQCQVSDLFGRARTRFLEHVPLAARTRKQATFCDLLPPSFNVEQPRVKRWTFMHSKSKGSEKIMEGDGYFHFIVNGCFFISASDSPRFDHFYIVL